MTATPENCPENNWGENTPPRIGVFICHCGGNIGDVVDVKRVAEEADGLAGVLFSADHHFVCSDPGQALIEQKIRELGLNRVIVAACSPSLHQLTFRRTIARAGLNPYLFEHVNLREQVSWVSENRELATLKAIRLVRAAVSRIRHLVPLDKRRIPIHPEALVIGGGIAGLVSARDLAQRGIRVTLVEKKPFLGVRVAQRHSLFPTGEDARATLNTLIEEVVTDPLVTILTNASIVDSEGVVGNFRTQVRIEPRGANERLLRRGEVLAACPVETANEFDFGLSRRKAIYLAFPGCYPPIPAIDWHLCTKCEKCVWVANGKGINLEEKPREMLIKSGVIVLATGCDPYEPQYGEYGYGVYSEVVILQQLIRMLDPEGPTGGKLPCKGNGPPRIAFIHCVGARQIQGINQRQPDGKVKEYCARICCTAALHTALQAKHRYPDAMIADFYQDIRTYGRGHEAYYERASEAGVLFIRYDPYHMPRVERNTAGDSPLLIRSRDMLTEGIEVEMAADLVVLVTGLVPHDIAELAGMYHCAVGADGFLLEVHPKLRPVELAVSGLFLAGTCQGPMDITESCAAASAASSKAAALIAQGQVEMDPFIARVDATRCTGCETCMTVCPYDAISRDEARGVAVISEARCTGCGTCAAACPSNAIQQAGFNDLEVMAELTALLQKP
ncbi:MAG TPA: CoB--CoM heterodisulfide reductase iron-sulfur subunit A family protein [Geobacteraceae bacterium]